MADRWMDDRDRAEREWRRQGHYSRDQYTRGGRDDYRGEYRGRGRHGEARSFDRDDDENDYRGDGGYEGGRDKVFGERETGASYGGQSGYLAGDQGYRGGRYDRDRPGRQNPDYGGVSPAMREAGGYGRGRFEGEDYGPGGPGARTGPGGEGGRYARGEGRGGRYYGDAGREPIYREEWSQGRRDYGEAPRGYDAGYSETRARYHDEGWGQPGFGGERADYGREQPPRPLWMGTASGGYDYDRGYGDAGRTEDRGRRFEEAGRNAGGFLHRAGQRVAEWFGGGEERSYGAEREGGRRGMGPQGYHRSDERISEDAHERLTEDAWLDATNVSCSVSGGEVTLAGTVESREAKHRAERMVEDISGVNHVQNNLRVQRPNYLTSDSTGYGDTVAEAQMRRDMPTPTSTSGDGGSAASRKQ